MIDIAFPVAINATVRLERHVLAAGHVTDGSVGGGRTLAKMPPAGRLPGRGAPAPIAPVSQR